MQQRQFKKATWVVFCILALVVIAAFGGIGLAAVRTAAARSPGIPLEAGSVIYDSTGMPVQLTESALVYSKNGYYYLGQGDTSVPLGPNTLAYTPQGIQIFGGGYRVESDGSVYKLSDTDIFTDSGSGAFFKLRDRRYAMAGARIADSKQVFSTRDYLYIAMDVVGNARLYSNDMSLKTTQPTVVQSGIFTFDIANELLTLGKQEIKMGALIAGGSTNTYDSGIYKTIEETQTPDSIDITIRGGAGGDGGTGGDGGDGGEGGDGGKGGSGGSGGQGGMGGQGGLGEEQKVVAIAALRSVLPASSTTVDVKYYFMDPFASMGMVYLEAHEASVLKAKGLNVQTLYNPTAAEKQASEAYWAGNFCARTSISAYDNSYTFTGLKPGTEYYITLGHAVVDADGTQKRVLDDYFLTLTKLPKDQLLITSVSEERVNFTLHLESQTTAAASVVLQDRSANPVAELGSYLLTQEDRNQAAGAGYSGTIPIAIPGDFRKVPVITLVVRDAAGSELTTLTAQASNNFYSQNTSANSSNEITIDGDVSLDPDNSGLYLLKFNMKLQSPTNSDRYSYYLRVSGIAGIEDRYNWDRGDLYEAEQDTGYAGILEISEKMMEELKKTESRKLRLEVVREDKSGQGETVLTQAEWQAPEPAAGTASVASETGGDTPGDTSGDTSGDTTTGNGGGPTPGDTLNGGGDGTDPNTQ